MIYLITTIVFTSVLLLALALLYHFLVRRSDITMRLETLFPEKKERKAIESGLWTDKLRRLGENVKLTPREHSKYSKVLVAAGLKRETIYPFLGSKILFAGLLPVAYFFLVAAPRQNAFAGQSMMIMAVAAIVGYLAPTYWLYARKKNRQLQIFHTLPDLLDLMTVCVEAGLSMDAALMRTTETPQFDRDPLAHEIRTASMESRAGKPRIEALRDMAERVMVDDVRSFVTMLAQTERFGTSLSQALRTFADSLRTKRRQMAEEAAAKTTIKMVFPLILFIFPALLVVILGPAIIEVSKIFK
jgi:tight adherence protein C